MALMGAITAMVRSALSLAGPTSAAGLGGVPACLAAIAQRSGGTLHGAGASQWHQLELHSSHPQHPHAGLLLRQASTSSAPSDAQADRGAPPAQPTGEGRPAGDPGEQRAAASGKKELSPDAASSTSSPTAMAFGARQVAQRRQPDASSGGVAGLTGAPLHGIVHVLNTYNNLRITLTDMQGNVKMSRMPTYRKDDTLRFLNARKRLPVATERTAASFAAAALKLGYGSAVVKMRGPGPHKQLAVQVLHACGLRITELQELTAIPYNGCRLPKRRRV